MFSTSYFIYGKGEGKEGSLGCVWKDIPIYDGIDLPVSLIRRNNQGII